MAAASFVSVVLAINWRVSCPCTLHEADSLSHIAEIIVSENKVVAGVRGSLVVLAENHLFDDKCSVVVLEGARVVALGFVHNGDVVEWRGRVV